MGGSGGLPFGCSAGCSHDPLPPHLRARSTSRAKHRRSARPRTRLRSRRDACYSWAVLLREACYLLLRFLPGPGSQWHAAGPFVFYGASAASALLGLVTAKPRGGGRPKRFGCILKLDRRRRPPACRRVMSWPDLREPSSSPRIPPELLELPTALSTSSISGSISPRLARASAMAASHRCGRDFGRCFFFAGSTSPSGFARPRRASQGSPAALILVCCRVAKPPAVRPYKDPDVPG